MGNLKQSIESSIESARAAAGNFFLFAWMANLMGGHHGEPASAQGTEHLSDPGGHMPETYHDAGAGQDSGVDSSSII